MLFAHGGMCPQTRSSSDLVGFYLTTLTTVEAKALPACFPATIAAVDNLGHAAEGSIE